MTYFKYKNSKVYYEEIGTGELLIMLHGNSVSSKMFNYVLDLYKEDFKVILIDFLGHGKSDRVDAFATDLWYDQSQQVISFCEFKEYKNINILGTSGGALTGINVALERPDLVCKLIADSFEGVKSIHEFAGQVKSERESAKKDEGAIGFWTYMHGDDWCSVVDLDTDAVIKHHEEIGEFFHKDITELRVPTLLIGSIKDEYCPLIKEMYTDLSSKITNSAVHIFAEGSHPSVITSADEFSKLTKKFLNE